MRIAYAGTPEFAVPALHALADSRHALVGVLTQPDRPAGRGRALRASPVKTLALSLGLPVAQPASLATPESRVPLAQWDCELLVVVAYGLLLPRAVLALPSRGCLNIHASLLPRWRGAAPVQRAILAGDAETGVTIMQLDEGLDTGPLLAQRRVPIGAHTNGAQLQTLLAQTGAELLLATLDAIATGGVRAEPQDAQAATYAHKIDKSEAHIDWRQSAAAIDRQVRAFNPWPIAETLWEGQRLRIWEAECAPQSAAGGTPGTVLRATAQGIEVLCGQGTLRLTRLQLPGRTALPAAEFIRGQALAGARFA
jgi:methionyl-tRNA formyltransferase